MANKEIDWAADLSTVEGPQPYAKSEGIDWTEGIGPEQPKPLNMTTEEAGADARNYFGANIEPTDLMAARTAVPRSVVDNPAIILQGDMAEAEIDKKYRDMFPILRPERKVKEPPIGFKAKVVMENSIFGQMNQRAYEYEAMAQGFVSPQEYADYMDKSLSYRGKRNFGMVSSSIGTMAAGGTAFAVTHAEKIAEAIPIVKMAKEGIGAAEQAWKYMFGENAGTKMLDDIKAMQVAFKQNGIEFAQEMQKISAEIAPQDPTWYEKLSGATASSLAFLVPGLGVTRAAGVVGMTPAMARTIGAGTMAVMESGVEGGGVQLEALARGKSEDEAELRGNVAFMLNLPLNFVLDKMGLSAEEGSKLWRWINKGGVVGRATKGYAAGFAAEGTQEAAQLAISEPLGKDRWPTLGEFVEEFAYGGVFGGVSSALQAAGASPYAKKGAPDSLTKVLDDVAAGKNEAALKSISESTGLAPEQVQKIAALDSFVSEEDKSVLAEAARYTQENAVDVSEVEVTDQDIEGVVSGEETHRDVIGRKLTESVVDMDEVSAVNLSELEAASVDRAKVVADAKADILSTFPGVVAIEEVEGKDIVVDEQVDIRDVDAAFKLKLKNGSEVTVLWGGKQTVANKAAVEKYGYKFEDYKGKPLGGQFIPKTVLGEDIISIGKLNDRGETMTAADKKQKLKHEVFHLIRKMMLDDKQMQILADRYADGDITNEEAVAKAYEIWDGKTKTSHGLFERIRDFARKLVNLYKYQRFASADSIFSDIETGKILEAEGKAKGQTSYSLDEQIDKRKKEIIASMGDVKQYRDLKRRWVPYKVAEILNNVVYVEEATPQDLERLSRESGIRLDRAMAMKFATSARDTKVDAYFGIGDTKGLGAKYDAKTGMMVINGAFINNPEKFDAATRRSFYYMLEDRGYITKDEIELMRKEMHGATMLASKSEKEKIMGSGGFDHIARANFYAEHWQTAKDPNSVMAKVNRFVSFIIETLRLNIGGRVYDIMESIDSGKILLRNNPAASQVMYSLEDDYSKYYKLANHILDANKMADRNLINLHKSIIRDMDNVDADMVLDNEQVINDLRRKTRAAQGVKNVIKAMDDYSVLTALEKTEKLLKKEAEYGRKLGEREGKEAKAETISELRTQHKERLQALKDRYKKLIAERAKRQKENIAKNRLKAQIFQLLKKSQPKVVDSIKRGKYTAATQSIIDGMYRAYKTSQELRIAALAEWRLKYGKRLEALKGKNDERSKLIKARLNALAEDFVAYRTAPALLEQSRKLNEMLLNGTGVNSVEVLGLKAEIKILNKLHQTNKNTTVEDLTDIRDSIKGVIDFAKEEKAFFNLEKHIKMERKLTDITEVLNEGRTLSDAQVAREAKRHDKKNRLIKFLDWSTLSYQNMLEQLSKHSKSNKLINHLEIWDAKKDYWAKHTKMVDMVADVYRKSYGIKSNYEIESVINDLNKQHDTSIEYTEDGKTYKSTLSRGEAIQRMMELLNPEIANMILENNYKGDTKKFNEMKSAVIELVNANKGDIEFIVNSQTVFEESYKMMNEVYRETYGTDLPRRDFYTPITRDYQTGKDLGVEEQYHNLQTVSPTAIHAMTKAKHRIKMQSIVSNMQRHSTNAVFYSAYAEKIYELNQLVYNPEVRQTIIERFGKESFDLLSDQLKSFVEGGKSGDALKYMDWMNTLRSNFGKAVLALKVKLLFTNATAAAGYMAEMPISSFFRYAVTDSWKMIENHKFMLENSTYYRYRMESFVDRDINEFMNSHEVKGFFDRPTVTNWMLVNIKYGDKAGLLLGGIPLYKYYYDQYKGQGMGDQVAKERAIEQFERVSEKNQQSSSMDMLTLGEKSKNVLLRALIQFTTQPRQYIAAEYMALQEISKGKDVKKNMQRIAVYHFVAPMLFQMFSDLFTGGDDDKEWYEKWGKVALFGSFNNLLLLGSPLEYMYSKIVGEKNVQTKKDFALLSPLEKDLPKMIQDMKAEDFFEALKHGADIAGKVTGVPIGTVWGMGTGIMEEMDTNNPEQMFGPDYEDILRIMSGTPRERIEKNKGGK